MSDAGFERQLHAAKRRLETLTRTAERLTEPHPLVGEAVKELSTALQELQVAADELQQQNEEIAATRELVEVERQRYQELFDFAPDGYLLTDPVGTIREGNRAVSLLLGVRQDLLPGKPLVLFVASPARRAFGAYLAQLDNGGPSDLGEWQTTLQPRSGPSFPVTVTTGRIQNPDGRLLGLRWLLRDGTERLRVEVARRQWEARLQHTQRLESLGVLAGGIAHDFNNLLTAILGSAELALLECPNEAPFRAALAHIITATHRAADLTNQMLAYSGRGTARVQPVRLSDLVREMGPLLHASLPKTCALEVSLGESLPPIEADATQLRQVVMNLIVNAGEAMGDKDGTITARVGVRECDRAFLTAGVLSEEIPEGSYVSLEVTDTGCGMSRETQDRMFEPFFTTKFTGRGLGLAAVLGIIRGHRGTIRVSSRPGIGTQIEVLLPPTSRPVIPDQPPASVPTDWRDAGTILVVDDEEPIRALARCVLEQRGFTVVTAADGQEAVTVFRQHADAVRAVLLDLTMPHLDGASTLRQLREIRPDVRVLLSSGYSEAEAKRQFTNRDLAGFLQKPYTMNGLIAAVQATVEPPAP